MSWFLWIVLRPRCQQFSQEQFLWWEMVSARTVDSEVCGQSIESERKGGKTGAAARVLSQRFEHRD